MSEDATERFAELAARDDDAVPLDEAALLIAAHGRPGLDVAAELGRIDELAAGCPAPTFEGWHRHLFTNLGFTGDRAGYDDPANSFLDHVIASRSGIPISLSVLGMEVGRRLGVGLAPIGMPGHFLLRDEARPAVFVDAFDGGRLLDRAGCAERYRAVHGPDAELDDLHLEPVGRRAVLSRMLANLKASYTRRNDLASLTWVLRLRLTLPGTSPIERRELAHVLGATGWFRLAADELDTLAPTMPELAGELEREAHAYRARLN